jgi:hypothetical protein
MEYRDVVYKVKEVIKGDPANDQGRQVVDYPEKGK